MRFGLGIRYMAISFTSCRRHCTTTNKLTRTDRLKNYFMSDDAKTVKEIIYLNNVSMHVCKRNENQRRSQFVKKKKKKDIRQQLVICLSTV